MWRGALGRKEPKKEELGGERERDEMREELKVLTEKKQHYKEKWERGIDVK